MTLAVKQVCDLKLVMRDDQITVYDRAHFLTYARILDAARSDQTWQEAAIEILELDVEGDEYGSYRIWDAHVDRAEWIIGEGLVLIVQNSSVPNQMIH